MGTPALVIVKNEDNTFTHVRVNFDGYPSHMLGALETVTDETILAAREIRFISPEGEVEAYSDAQPPEIHDRPFREGYSYAYARDEDGAWVEI
uniref:Uncharacterized protein n=1 Tax=Dinoroseobacter phage vB_DshS_R26L TaxID=3161158 RepID=A0AAU7VGM6_9CAUD